MQVYKRMAISLVIALLLFFVAIFSSFIPCKIFPAPLNSEPYWASCSLSPDGFSGFQTSKVLYLGYSESLIGAYLTTLSVVFVLSFLILSWMFKSKKH